MSIRLFAVKKSAGFTLNSPRLRCGGLLVLAMIGLSGCREKPAVEMNLHQKLHPIEVNTIRDDPFTASMRNLPNPEPPKLSVEAAPPTANADSLVPADSRNANRYYIDISDVYWKLNWMRKELLHGTVPYNMLDEIEKTRKTLRKVNRDGNYALAAEALDRFEQGLAHLACLRVLKAAKIDDMRLPWEAGVFAVQRQMDAQSGISEKLPAPTRRTTVPGDDSGEEDEGAHIAAPNSAPDTALDATALGQQQASSLALDYARRYHNSPRAMMQREWETAIQKTNRLRDNLALANRPENNDGDSTEVGRAVALAAGDYGSIHVPPSAGLNGAAPAPIETRY